MWFNGLKRKDILLVCFSVCVIAANLYMIFDNAFWTDEVFTINLAKKSYFAGIAETAADVHPPLYYMILKTFCLILGYKAWVYHFASVFAFIGVVIVANLQVKKELGCFVAACLISICGFSFVGATYNVEVRMYSWATFFVTGVFIYCYKVLKDNQIRDWIIFTVFALASAYTHYFAMLTVFCMAFLLYLMMIIKKRKNVWKGILTSIGIAVIGYIPWLVILLRTFREVSDNYWIVEYPGWKSCLKWIFGETSISIKLCVLTFLLLSFLLIIRYFWEHSKILRGIFVIEDKEGFTNEICYVLIGLGTIVLTVFVSMAISKLNRPVLQLRYLAPMIGIAAICMGLLMLKCLDLIRELKEKKVLYTIIQIIVIFTLTFGMIKSGYCIVLQKYIMQRNDTMTAMQEIKEYGMADKKMLVSQARMVLKYYCPEAIMEKYSEENLEEALCSGDEYMLFLNENVFDEQLEELIESKGYISVSFGIMRLSEEIYDVYCIHPQ